jgi:PAS domain S-box-containing protein
VLAQTGWFDAWHTGVAAILLLLQAVLIATLLVHRARGRRADVALQRSDAQTQALLRALPDLMFLQSRDGVYLDYHVKDVRDLLLPPSEFLGKNMRDVLPAPLADRFAATFAVVNASSEPAVVEYALPLSIGTRYFEARIVTCGPDDWLLSIVRDITDRKDAEQALRRERERYSLATSAGRVGVWDWNVETGDMYLDPELKNILGYADHELPNRIESWRGLMHPDDGAFVEASAAADTTDALPAFETEHRLLHKNGGARWFLSRGAIRVQVDGSGRHMIGTTTDVDARRRAEDALNKAQAEVARLSRLTAMGELTSSIAHDVNQPLCAIVTNAQTSLRWLSAEAPEAPAYVRDALQDIVADANRASGLIQSTRKLFTHRQAERDLLAVNDLVREVLSLARRPLQDAGIGVLVLLDDGLPPVVADRELLQQVVLTLIMNAIDAMSDSREREVVVRSRLHDEGAQVLVSVTDAGDRVPAAGGEDVFQASHTPKPEMGIGLAISRAIVASHGGRLWASANHPKGATFQFLLPVPTNGDVAR